MADKADVEKPISLVEPSHAKSVQAIIDRAYHQETSTNKSLYRSVNKALRPPHGKGLLSKTLGMALAHHGPMKKGSSLRPTAPDTNGRAFHFSHSTVGRGSAGAARSGGNPPGGGGLGGEGPSTGSSSGGASGSSKSGTVALIDLGSKEAGHQRYVERDAVLARDAVEEFGIPAEGRQLEVIQRPDVEIDGGMEPGQSRPRKEKPIELDIERIKKEIEQASKSRSMQSAVESQHYIEDPEKVAPAMRHGHSNSFGTIGPTFEDRVKYWNDVQAHEREKDARTQIRLVLELPHEATPTARQEIVKEFCERYEELGVPYWASIHTPTKKNDDRNHHAHIVHGIRPAKQMIDPATGEMAWDFTIVQSYKTACRHTKKSHPFRQNAVKDFWHRDYIRDTRKRFADTANVVLEKYGSMVRYDARSYKDMGLDIEPMKHVSRIIADKSKIHDFVVMDPVWTRKMVEREMHVAALERDKTYMQLKRVEKSLAEAARTVAKAKKANEKLPNAMKVSPFSKMTTAAAQRITTKMLEVERAKIEQRFADEAITRTIQDVIDATSPISSHRNGKSRRALPADGAEAPNARAMAFLHDAAREEMRLHRIATSSRVTKLGYRALGALDEWRREAAPPVPPTVPDATPAPRERLQTTAATMSPAMDAGVGTPWAKAFTVPTPVIDELVTAPAMAPAARQTPMEQPTIEPEPARTPTPQQKAPTFRPGLTAAEMAIAGMAGNPRMQAAMSTLSSKMSNAIGNIIAMAEGPAELGDMVRAMMAQKPQAPPPGVSTPAANEPAAPPVVTRINSTEATALPATVVVANPLATTLTADERNQAAQRPGAARSPPPGRTPGRSADADAAVSRETRWPDYFPAPDYIPPPAAARATRPMTKEQRDERPVVRSVDPAELTADRLFNPIENLPTPAAREATAPTSVTRASRADQRPEATPQEAGNRQVESESKTSKNSIDQSMVAPTPPTPDRPASNRPVLISVAEPSSVPAVIPPVAPALAAPVKEQPRILRPDDFLPTQRKPRKLEVAPEGTPLYRLDLPVLRPAKPSATPASSAAPYAQPPDLTRSATIQKAPDKTTDVKKKKPRRKVIITRSNGLQRD